MAQSSQSAAAQRKIACARSNLRIQLISVDRSFCGDGPFCSVKQVLINAFSDSSNALLVLDGYVMAVIKKSEFLCLFDSHALLDEINSLLHVALHSVTFTNCPNDHFMNLLLPLYM